MKSLLLTFTTLFVSLELGHAVAITLGQTAGAARFFSYTGLATPSPNTGTVSMGWMSNPADASSFVEFASTTMHGNTVFTTGVGTIAGNSVSTRLPEAAGKAIYVRVIDGANGGGIWQSSVLYPADLAGDSITPGAASLSSDTWTVVTPTQNWAYLPSTYTANAAPLGLSDAQTAPTARTGDAFILGAPIPEPTGSMLALLSFGLLTVRRKR